MKSKSARVIMLIIIMVGIFVSCTNNTTVTKPEPIPRTSIYDIYSLSEYSSFVKLKVNSVSNVLYGEISSTKYLLCECVVVEDYYQNIEAHTIINLPVSLNVTILREDSGLPLGVSGFLDYDMIKEFLLKQEYLLVYISDFKNSELLFTSEGTRYENGNITSKILLNRWHIIPLNEQLIDLNAVSIFLNNNNIVHLPYQEIVDFGNLFTNQMSEIDAIKNLYQFFDEQKA